MCLGMQDSWNLFSVWHVFFFQDNFIYCLAFSFFQGSSFTVRHAKFLCRCNPTTNGGLVNGSSVGICIHCIHIFAHLAPVCMLSRFLLAKFLHQSSVESLLKLRCWLGKRIRNLGYTFLKKNRQMLPFLFLFF